MDIAVQDDLYFWVTRGIARRAGVNIDEAMHEGRMSRIAFTRMIERCRVCPRADDCLSYLAHPQGQDPSWYDQPCRNAEVLAELRAPVGM
ncbi:MAG TPA: DUF6455 family protein [Paenirhodobacter sp.]